MRAPATCTPSSCIRWETCAHCRRRFSTDEPDRDCCYQCVAQASDEWAPSKPRSVFVVVKT